MDDLQVWRELFDDPPEWIVEMPLGIPIIHAG